MKTRKFQERKQNRETEKEIGQKYYNDFKKTKQFSYNLSKVLFINQVDMEKKPWRVD